MRATMSVGPPEQTPRSSAPAATDMFAPLRCSIRPEAQHCPRPAAEIGGGEVSPSYVRRNLNVRISQSAGLLVPRGGKRPGAGRKKGTKNKRRRTVVEAHAEVAMLAAAKPDTVTPLAHMLSILNNPDAPEGRKDQMAISAAPYMHPKLNLSATSQFNGGGNCVTNIQFLVIPRGCFLSPEQIADPSSLIEYGEPFEPGAMPTPALIDQTAPPVEPEPAPEPLEVLEPVDDGKIVTLRRRDEPGAQ
jgi:hypothetical protein